MRSSTQIRAFIGYIIISLLVLSFVIYLGSDGNPPANVSDKKSIDSWLNIPVAEIKGIIVLPHNGDVYGQETISSTLQITNNALIVNIINELRTQNKRFNYLDGAQHWTTKRRVIISIYTLKQQRINMCVDWLINRQVCGFGLMREQSVYHSSANVYHINASDVLPIILDEVFASNGVSWVQGDL